MAYATIQDIEAGPGEPGEYHINIMHLITPETQHSMHYWAFIGCDFGTDDPSIGDALRAAALKAFDEDREALEWIDKMNRKENWPSHDEASFASDRGSPRRCHDGGWRFIAPECG